MSVPKKRRTKSSAGKRRSHHALKKTTLGTCPQCGRALKPHTACNFCGTYKGREVIAVKNKDKKLKKKE